MQAAFSKRLFDWIQNMEYRMSKTPPKSWKSEICSVSNLDLTIGQCSVLLQVSAATVWRLIKAKSLCTYKVGRSTRITFLSVESLRRGCVPATLEGEQ
jgi:excisionase family DNA binding protein